jgi:hypothetical protein
VGTEVRKFLRIDGGTGEAQTSEMKRMTWTVLLAMVGLAILPQTVLAGQFKKPVYYAAPGLPVAVVTADFNNDTNLDLAVADFGNRSVLTLMGRGDGSFRKGPSFSVAAPYTPAGLAVGDFDGDRTLDLAVVEYNGPANGKLGIFLGNGDGTFHQSAEYQVGFEPLSAAVADFDGDGHLDVAVTNEGVNGKGSVIVFFGNGDGTFQKPTIYNLSAYPYSVAAGDLNGDGRPDIAVAEYTAGVAVLLNRGGGKFGKAVVYPVNPANVTSVTIAELNHDQHPDLVVATFDAVGVLLGKSGGKFQKTVLYSTTSISSGNPYAVVVADFNLDGNPDIATVLEAGNSALFYGKGDGGFGKPIPIKLRKGGGLGIATGDFNKDHAPDLAIITNTAQVAILLNSQ